MSSLPVIPIAQLQVQTVSAKRVRALKVTPMGTFDASVVWLAKG
jgi:MarR-like DNA-binding transcriptional regulator SgrR of sgrS sRNA